MRTLVIVLGDQLDRHSAALDGFDPARDAIWMAEVAEESTHVWAAKQRIAVFLSGMRHYRDEMRASGRTVLYRELAHAPGTQTTGSGEPNSLAEALALDVAAHQPERLVMVEPGDHRVLLALQDAAGRLRMPLEVRTDRHHLCTIEEFAAHAAGRKQLRMEHFYRMMRRRHEVLMDGEQPAGGSWNYDADNRGAFPAAGPGMIPEPVLFPPDQVTGEVLDLVRRGFAGHPGTLKEFTWPVTPEQAHAALADFVENRLPLFGRYQDAIWLGEPWLFHARISVALNLKLLDPREVITSAEAAWREGRAPLAAVEGFIRQVLGWREYVRGIYWARMPEYAGLNALGADRPLPEWYWTGDTPMACLNDAIGQTLRLGYAHHIQRLMVTGLFAQLLGVDPRAVHEWYLAVYVDAVEWVELPNVLGMSQYADGGVMASKPYVATGKYIARMSNACRACPFDPAVRTGPTACPFTTLYWDFLIRHDELLAGNPRMALQVRNARGLPIDERAAIRARADEVRAEHR
ncbi:MAG TPA: cryptochrome/photolyase family protein [Motilibacterales bacterium]|nr:cryptochrome/photolyase family protein [Motilibacterales bacterium]